MFVYKEGSGYMIDVDGIASKFVQIAREPTYTPTLSVDTDSGFKNVFKARPVSTPKPDYPYIVVDITEIRQENGWLFRQYVNPSDEVVYETHYELLVAYHIYGEGAKAIANQLEGYFRFNRVRDDLTTVTGGKLVQKLPIEQLPKRLADKFVDSAIFNIVFAITDTSIDSQEGIIDNLNIDGELHRYVGDPDPLEADISVTYNP
jgi:hypothetical protein